MGEAAEELVNIPEGLMPLPFMRDTGVDTEALNRGKTLWADFRYAGSKIEAQPHFLAAIGFRESRIQSILGDGGRGHGIMQLDTGSFKGLFLPGMPAYYWKDPAFNILGGAYCWQGKYDYLATETDLAGPLLYWFATAAYNCGEGTMHKVWEAHSEELAGLSLWDMAFWQICDKATTGKDYARTVFRHYQWLLKEIQEGA